LVFPGQDGNMCQSYPTAVFHGYPILYTWMERNGVEQISLSKERNNRTRPGLAKPQPKFIASTTKHIALLLKGIFSEGSISQ